MNENKCFIIGLPEAGKTTYLAALWYFLNYKKDGSLRVKKFIGDHSYLSSISRKWADTEEIPRTKPEFEKLDNILTLENSEKDNIILAFPDLSGESFQYQYERREAEKKHYELIINCLGVLLFIHPEKIKEPCLISDIPLHLRKNEEYNDNISEHSPRNPRENDPTQVQLVELLQFITYMRNNKPVNLCIIISAWDLVEETSQKEILPEEFIKSKMPLLWQYLISNSERLLVSYYGISAQGGKLQDSDKLLEITNPCERIRIIDNNGTLSKDITLPLIMIMRNVQ